MGMVSCVLIAAGMLAEQLLDIGLAATGITTLGIPHKSRESDKRDSDTNP